MRKHDGKKKLLIKVCQLLAMSLIFMAVSVDWPTRLWAAQCTTANIGHAAASCSGFIIQSVCLINGSGQLKCVCPGSGSCSQDFSQACSAAGGSIDRCPSSSFLQQRTNLCTCS